MPLSDLHPVVGLILATACALFAFLLLACVPVFWRRSPNQKQGTVLPCRIMALVMAVLGVAFAVVGGLHVVAAIAGPAAAVYGWLVL